MLNVGRNVGCYFSRYHHPNLSRKCKFRARISRGNYQPSIDRTFHFPLWKKYRNNNRPTVSVRCYSYRTSAVRRSFTLTEWNIHVSSPSTSLINKRVEWSSGNNKVGWSNDGKVARWPYRTIRITTAVYYPRM